MNSVPMGWGAGSAQSALRSLAQWQWLSPELWLEVRVGLVAGVAVAEDGEIEDVAPVKRRGAVSLP